MIRSRPAAIVAALLFSAALGYLLFQLIQGRDRLVEVIMLSGGRELEIDDILTWPFIAAIGLIGLIALGAWWKLAGAGTDFEAIERAEKAERERTELAAELEAERERAERERNRYEAERKLGHKLAEQLQRMNERLGVLGDQRDDLPSMVLGVAMELLEAEKGLLLSRYDSEGDGDLDLVAANGFESDPAESKLAQRFAGEVIAQGEVVRQSRSDVEDEDAEGVDEEIENLIAIPIYIHGNFDGIVVCANGSSIEQEDEVLLALGDSAGSLLENSRLHNELRASYLATVRMLAEALEVKDPFLRGHSEEVSGLVRAMAMRLDLPGQDIERLVFGSLLHDVGKIGISERILLKPGPLTDEEFDAVKLHPRIGYRLISQLPALQQVAPAVLHHHERYDGTGYPAGLAGERIPLEARIIAIIDAYSAMISDRPYQEAVTSEEALAELERCAGTHFDPDLVEIFVAEVEADIEGEGREVPTSLAEALDDPALQELRGDANPMIGFDSFALTDNLTLVRSHRYLRERLARECERAETSGEVAGPALVLIQIDNMDPTNEELGYSGGDRLLRMVARGLERIATASSDVVARDAGSRFGVLVVATDVDQVGELADQAREAIPDALEARIGFAHWRAGDTQKTLVTRAKDQLGGSSDPSGSPGGG